MEKFIRNYSFTSIVMSIMLIVIGIFILVFPGIISSIMTLIGIALIIIGVISTINSFRDKNEFTGYSYDFAIGMTTLIFGIVMLVNPLILLQVFPIIVGIFIIFQSILKLQLSINMKNNGNKSYIFVMITSVLTAIFGILLAISSLKSVETVIGIFLIIYGLFDFIQTIFVLKTLKK